MEARTTIQIEHKLLIKLKKWRITKRESYNELLYRILVELSNYRSMEKNKGS